uniref:Uncharacterized protein n=1 Tax=Rousettus aegyptiacus TaxID=9407 RepID=A0A7J8C284_ROUAE|nr:hypothetical protein HJG63_009285 [Rousettus aegyptiacus]
MAHSQDRVPRGRASLPVGDSEWLWGANHWGEPRGVTAGDRQSPPRPQDSPPWPPRQRRHRPYSGPACATPPSESLRWLPWATERCPTRAEASAASALGSQPVCCWLSAPQPDGCSCPWSRPRRSAPPSSLLGLSKSHPPFPSTQAPPAPKRPPQAVRRDQGVPSWDGRARRLQKPTANRSSRCNARPRLCCPRTSLVVVPCFLTCGRQLWRRSAVKTLQFTRMQVYSTCVRLCAAYRTAAITDHI